MTVISLTMQICGAILVVALAATTFQVGDTFVIGATAPTQRSTQRQQQLVHMSLDDAEEAPKQDVLDAAIAAMFGGGSEYIEGPEATLNRIRNLVDEHPVLLFMKGTKAFPQCGFSDTATKILERYGVDYHAVDVLADEAIRQGIKDYSQWPTIPQVRTYLLPSLSRFCSIGNKSYEKLHFF